MKHILQHIFLFIICFLNLTLFSQTGKLLFKGEQISSEAAISFYFDGGQDQAYSENGEFKLDFSADKGYFIIEFNNQKYASDTIRINPTKNLKIELSEQFRVLHDSVAGFLPEGTYFIQDTLLLKNTDSLQIEAGCSFRFANNAYFKIEGKFLADGTISDTIRFSPITDKWLGLHIEANGKPVKCNYCSFKGIDAETAIAINSSKSVTFNRCRFENIADSENSGASSCFKTVNATLNILASIYINNKVALCAGFTSEIALENCIIAKSGGGYLDGFVYSKNCKLTTINCTFHQINIFTDPSTLFMVMKDTSNIFNIYNTVFNECYVLNSLVTLNNSSLINVKIANSVINELSYGIMNKTTGYTYIIDWTGQDFEDKVEITETAPAFLDEENSIFLLAHNSPLIDAANDAVAPDTDIFGQKRNMIASTATNKTDIGACEYIKLQSNTLQHPDTLKACSGTIAIPKPLQSQISIDSKVVADFGTDTAFISFTDSAVLDFNYFNYYSTKQHIRAFEPEGITFSRHDTVCSTSVRLFKHPLVPAAIQWSSNGSGHFSDSKTQKPEYYFSTSDSENGQLTINAQLSDSSRCGISKLTYTFDLIPKRELVDPESITLCQAEKIELESIKGDSVIWNNTLYSEKYSFIPKNNTIVSINKTVGSCILFDTVFITMKVIKLSNFDTQTENASVFVSPLEDLSATEFRWLINNESYYTQNVYHIFDTPGIQDVCLEVKETESGCLSSNCQSVAAAFTKHTLEGQVFAHNYTVDSARATLFCLAFGRKEYIGEYWISQYGYFSFPDIPSGNYTIYIDDIYTQVPAYFSPTYYGNTTYDIYNKYIILNDDIHDADIFLSEESIPTGIGETPNTISIFPTIAKNYLYSTVDILSAKLTSVLGEQFLITFKNGNASIEHLKPGWYFIKALSSDQNIEAAFYKE